ncbi:beta-glucanase [Paenibacillus albidus]|uniref:beta-glucanase n=1 Tax=Paenibacillus albidus TaxID=2041023 RepID=UPI0028899070|nr:glycoside hydrolase family 16 protein [Paenibacillus albidus]
MRIIHKNTALWKTMKVAVALFIVGVLPQTAFAETPSSAAAAGFTENLNSYNSSMWYKSDGWDNGDDFGAFWKQDHVEFNSGIMALRLDNAGCPGSCEGKSFASGEYATHDTYGYGRVEGRLKVAKGTGLVTSLFTYANRETNPQLPERNDEIDIEILGKDTTKLEMNYYTNGVGSHETVIDLGFDAAAGYHTYAFEWSPSAIKWYVDGNLVHTENGSRGELPSRPGQIMVNLWPGAGDNVGWTGQFNYTGTPVKAYYDWIKFTPSS